MGKLLELLKDQYWEVVTYNIQSDWGYMFYISWFAVREERLLSKKFWFVKWLIENDKIETDAYKTVYSGDLDKRKTLTMSSGWDEFYQVTEHWAYESLLMLLAVQPEPIEFLISILK